MRSRGRRSRGRTPLAVFPVTERGRALAHRIAATGAWEVETHAPAELKRGGLARLVGKAFKSRTPMLFICASGIAVRTVAPYLSGKEKDPAVVVMDEAARFAVSLVSGHLGRANALAREIAALFKATPVITTATDVAGLPCAEDIALKFSLTVENAGAIKRVNSALLKGAPVLVIDPDPARRKEAGALFSPAFGFSARFPSVPGRYAAFVVVSSAPGGLPPWVRAKALVLRPVEFTLGVGCGRGVSEARIAAAVGKALKEANVALRSVKALATIDIKKDEPGLTSFASSAGLALEFYSAAELGRAIGARRGSRAVKEATGAAGVSEPAALLSSGARRLWRKKKKYGHVTVAVARVRSR